MAKTRIQKVLSENGILSRRKAEEYVAQGRITVNGRRAETGAAVDPERDIIAIDGVRLELSSRVRKVYILLNKPRGYVTTLSDELGASPSWWRTRRSGSTLWGGWTRTPRGR